MARVMYVRLPIYLTPFRIRILNLALKLIEVLILTDHEILGTFFNKTFEILAVYDGIVWVPPDFICDAHTTFLYDARISNGMSFSIFTLLGL